jgi:hypothetical protein
MEAEFEAWLDSHYEAVGYEGHDYDKNRIDKKKFTLAERTLHPRTPVKKPNSIEQIRQRIQKAFETVRNGVAAELRTAPQLQRVSGVEAAVEPMRAKPRRPLTEIAARLVAPKSP